MKLVSSKGKRLFYFRGIKVENGQFIKKKIMISHVLSNTLVKWEKLKVLWILLEAAGR